MPQEGGPWQWGPVFSDFLPCVAPPLSLWGKLSGPSLPYLTGHLLPHRSPPPPLPGFQTLKPVLRPVSSQHLILPRFEMRAQWVISGISKGPFHSQQYEGLRRSQGRWGRATLGDLSFHRVFITVLWHESY